ncbi:MAG: type II toxin-antitoxin system RelE/ParE family toxin [Clostridia bacterium]
MYKIIFYKNKNGYSEIEEYIKLLSSKRNNSKDCKIKFTKITSYIDLLSEKGLNLGEPYIKHINGDIWELRPLRDRILFAYWDNNKFILLHQFMKQTQKTPLKEIEKAKKNLADYKKRSDDDG